MIKHIVSWKVKQDLNTDFDKTLKAIKSSLAVLREKIDVIRFYEIGINLSQSKNAFDIILVSEFDSLDDLEYYRVHPEHQVAVEFISPRVEKSMVVDYEF